jgi:hypothetical protein
MAGRHLAYRPIDMNWHGSLLAALALAMLACADGGTAMAVEQPKFEIEEAKEDFQLRRYGPTVVAETTVDGSFGDAGNQAFRRLAGYIFGANDGGRKIAMTAPVAQAKNDGTKIAMSAPVSQEKRGEGWIVSFTMPSAFTMATLPRPNDARVTLREVAGRRVAAIRFSGTWSPERFAEKALELESEMARRKLTAGGPPVYARYDPPWTPWFLRRNEVLVPIAGSGSKAGGGRSE